jgi:DNA-directed RNA polymerase subunit M/transcription elongation factor TFIIS
MLDKDIDPEPVKECPDCSGKMIEEGDKFEGTATCEECGYSEDFGIVGDE